MYELTAENVVAWLRETGHLAADEPATAEWLAWGVSNVVLRITRPATDDIVLKQSRARLRTEVEWISRLDRIWREAELMRELGGRLPAGTVPQVLFEDRDNYAFAMQAISADHVVWKAELLAGTADSAIARQAGELLGTLHQSTFGDSAAARKWGDREVFEQLRVDPFYHHVARVHPQLEPAISRMVAEMDQRQECVVHADFSPKNLLITGPLPAALSGQSVRLVNSGDTGESARQLALVDWETGHYGDPAFDLGFFLSHLLLKAVLHAPQHEPVLVLVREFLRSYATARGAEQDILFRRSLLHLAGCMLSRIDGTSTIDYLPQPGRRDVVRRFTFSLLLEPAASMDEALGRLVDGLEESSTELQ